MNSQMAKSDDAVSEVMRERKHFDGEGEMASHACKLLRTHGLLSYNVP